MIASGKKTEEYRDMKLYWWTRFIDHCDADTGEIITKTWDIVRFKNGYAKDAPEMDVEFVEVRIIKNGMGITEWGFAKKCFGIKLGKILSIKNYK